MVILKLYPNGTLTYDKNKIKSSAINCRTEIHYDEISNIEYKNPSLFKNGNIEFKTINGKNFKCFFLKKRKEEAQKAYEEILQLKYEYDQNKKLNNSNMAFKNRNEIRFCYECGTKINANTDNFCSNCGADLRVITQKNISQSNTENKNKPNSIKNKKEKRQKNTSKKVKTSNDFTTQKNKTKPEITNKINEKINKNHNYENIGITFKNINSTEINATGKTRYRYDSEELFVEEVALKYYNKKGYAGLFSENNYWWHIYVLLFWDIIFMRTDTCTQVTMDDPNFEKMYDFTITMNGMPLDFFKDLFYEERKNEINKRIMKLMNSNLNTEIKKSYKKNYGRFCRPIEDWDRYTLNELLIITKYLKNYQILSIMDRLIRNFRENRSGLPDLLIYNENELKLVEVKSKNDNLSENQIKWHKYIIESSKIPVEIFTVNKSERQINNLHKKYNPELIEKKISTKTNTSNTSEPKYSFVPDGLIEVKYKEISTSEAVKAMDYYSNVVLDYEDKAQKLEKTKPEEAIAIYEKLVYEYKFGGNFPHDRLLVLYRKQEKYKEMINVCDAAIANLGHNEYLIGNRLMIESKIKPIGTDKKIERFKERKRKTELLLINKPLEDKIKIAKKLEKEKEIDKAIKKYEEVIQEKYPKKFPYTRLCILYRKKKNYKKELKTCNLALKYLTAKKERDWFKERKIKVEEKISKQ